MKSEIPKPKTTEWIDWEDVDGNNIYDLSDDEIRKLDNARDGFGLEVKL